MDRQTRKAIKHDKFLDQLNNAYTFAARNRKPLIMAAVAIVILAVAAAALAAYSHRQEIEAQKVLAEGIEVMQTPVGERVIATSTSYESEEARQKAAEEIFRRVVDEYGSRDAADVASLYLAQIEARRGDYDSARARFESFVDDHPEHLLAASAEVSLLNMKLAAGETDALITELQERIDGESDRLPRPVLLALLAQAYEMKGDQEKAIQAYRRIANEFPDSPYSLDAQRKLAQG